MKNRKGNLLMTLGLVLILAALALVGYNQWDASRAQQESDDALMALEQIRIQRQMESQQTAAPPVVTATMMPTDTPATDAPITDAPTADATAADNPAASTPAVTDALPTDFPRDDVTATNTPVTDAPATANPATNPPKPTSVFDDLKAVDENLPHFPVDLLGHCLQAVLLVHRQLNGHYDAAITAASPRDPQGAQFPSNYIYFIHRHFLPI